MKPDLTMAYSDLLTLAGIMRLWPTTKGDQVDRAIIAIPVVRDMRVPAGCVEIRHDDGRVERYVLPLIVAATVREEA